MEVGVDSQDLFEVGGVTKPTHQIFASFPFERSYSRLKLWSEDCSLADGKVNASLQHSHHAFKEIRKYLVGIGEILLERLIPLLTSHPSILEPESLKEDISAAKAVLDAFRDSQSYASSSDDSSDYDNDTYEDIAEDLRTDTIALVDLEPLLQNHITVVDKQYPKAWINRVEWIPQDASSHIRKPTLQSGDSPSAETVKAEHTHYAKLQDRAEWQDASSAVTSETCNTVSAQVRDRTQSINIKSVRKPSKRRPKVATSCSNCKQRRIKCDERRPACSQCIRSKKLCKGYPPPLRAKIHKQVKIEPRPNPTPWNSSFPGVAPSSAHTEKQIAWAVWLRTHDSSVFWRSSLTAHKPSVNLPLDPQEGRYFQLFRERVTSELSGFLDTSVWTRIVLQECHSAETNRHSVVALGALYKTLERMSEARSRLSSSSDNSDFSDLVVRHWEMAFRHYNIAVKALVSVRPKDQVSQRSLLMAHVLLAYFNCFIGDHKEAILQIINGLRLLQELRGQCQRSSSSHSEGLVGRDVIQIYTRLAIQTKSYCMPYMIRFAFKDEAPTSLVFSQQRSIPSKFQSLFEARLVWDCLCERIMRLKEATFQYTASTTPIYVPRLSLKQFTRGLTDDIETWSHAFQMILDNRNAPGKSSQEKTAISVLKMFQLTEQILLLTHFSPSELQFDAFFPQFKIIVELATEIVAGEERRAVAETCPDPRFCQHQFLAPHTPGGHLYAAKHIKPSFSTDMGIVPPLFLVATKCRDPITRRQAIQLLRSSPRREWLWDSELSARIAMFIIGVEEEDDDTPKLSVSTAQSEYSSTLDNEEQTPLRAGSSSGWRRQGRHGLSLPAQEPPKFIPEEKRIELQAIDFDLRDRTATLQCGSRKLTPGIPDLKPRITRIVW